ncbi:MAG: ATP-binding protein [Lutimonas sp.]
MANTYHQIYIKLFQPLSELIRTGFFTTKPTGSGTGLGLSLSYDIIKAHGGELSLVTVRQSETVFTMYLHIENSKNQ